MRLVLLGKYLFPELGNVEQHFKQFNEFSVNCCKPMGTVLMSQQEVCRFCGKVLAVEPTTHVVVIYHEQRRWQLPWFANHEMLSCLQGL